MTALGIIRVDKKRVPLCFALPHRSSKERKTGSNNINVSNLMDHYLYWLIAYLEFSDENEEINSQSNDTF